MSLLQIISRAWISILQVRRRMFCLLDHLCQAQLGRSQESVHALSGEAKSEIWSLCALGGIAMADLRAQSRRELFLSDASEEFTASVKVDISKELSSELHRHLSFTVIAWPEAPGASFSRHGRAGCRPTGNYWGDELPGGWQSDVRTAARC